MATWLGAFALSVPLALVVLVSLYASLPAAFRWTENPGYSDTYPVRVNLTQAGSALRAPDTALAQATLAAAQQTDGQDAVDQSPTPIASGEPGANSSAQPVETRSLTNLADVAAGGQTAATQPRRPGGLLPINFDLASGFDPAQSIQVRKDVQYQGRRLGSIAVAINSASSVAVSQAELARILPEARRLNRDMGGEFVALSRLRSAGLDLRYDPIRDVFVLGE